MRRVLVGVFYVLQGLGNLVLGLFFVWGGRGGVGYFIDVVVRSLVVFASCLSLFTAVILLLRRHGWAQVFGDMSSLLFGLLYGQIAAGAFFAIVHQYSINLAFGLLLSIAIVILNVASVVLVHGMSKQSTG